ncbi:MAG: hypothetical protein AAF702_00315 [Chloroflexota bacterium]
MMKSKLGRMSVYLLLVMLTLAVAGCAISIATAHHNDIHSTKISGMEYGSIDETPHWSYEGTVSPAFWHELDEGNSPYPHAASKFAALSSQCLQDRLTTLQPAMSHITVLFSH